MSLKGSPGAIFWRAIERRNLIVAETVPPTGRSFARSAAAGANVVLISLPSVPTHEPRDSGARVLTINPTEQKPAEPAAARAQRRAGVWPPGTIVRHLPDGSEEVTFTQEHVIRRPGIGQVLGVR